VLVNVSIFDAFPKGIDYCKPREGLLLHTSGSSWDYQASHELKVELRNSIYLHYSAVRKKMFDIKFMPVYLFLSGAGTGESRNAQEFHQLALQCFDVTYGFSDSELETSQD
jgi:hypothetical protein